jgi:hypothetical protein
MPPRAPARQIAVSLLQCVARRNGMADTTHPQADSSLNWSYVTLAYTFVLGAVAGSVYAIASGQVDAAGKVLTIYLSILGALFAGALGWFGARSADSLGDRRKRRRRILVMQVQLVALVTALERLTTALKDASREDRENLPSLETSMSLLVAARDVKTYSSFALDFDEIIDDISDAAAATKLQVLLRHLADSYEWVDLERAAKGEHEMQQFGARARGPLNHLETMKSVQEELNTINQHFAVKRQ